MQEKEQAVCQETAHLLSSPRNAERLRRTIQNAASDSRPNRITLLAMEEGRRRLLFGKQERAGTQEAGQDDDRLDVPEN